MRGDRVPGGDATSEEAKESNVRYVAGCESSFRCLLSSFVAEVCAVAE